MPSVSYTWRAGMFTGGFFFFFPFWVSCNLICLNYHWFITRASEESRARAYHTCSPSKCFVWLKLLFACVWVGMHIAALCCHLAEGRKHVTGFSSYAYMHRARTGAALPAFCRLGSFSPMEIHAHALQGSFGSDSSAKKEGEKCWKAELLGRAQMDAFAEWLPETPVPAASSLPLFFPLGTSVLRCWFWSRSLCFPSLLILWFVVVVVVVFFCILRVLLAQSVFCYRKAP